MFSLSLSVPFNFFPHFYHFSLLSIRLLCISSQSFSSFSYTLISRVHFHYKSSFQELLLWIPDCPTFFFNIQSCNSFSSTLWFSLDLTVPLILCFPHHSIPWPCFSLAPRHFIFASVLEEQLGTKSKLLSTLLFKSFLICAATDPFSPK